MKTKSRLHVIDFFQLQLFDVSASVQSVLDQGRLVVITLNGDYYRVLCDAFVKVCRIILQASAAFNRTCFTLHCAPP